MKANLIFEYDDTSMKLVFNNIQNSSIYVREKLSDGFRLIIKDNSIDFDYPLNQGYIVISQKFRVIVIKTYGTRKTDILEISPAYRWSASSDILLYKLLPEISRIVELNFSQPIVVPDSIVFKNTHRYIVIWGNNESQYYIWIRWSEHES